MISPASADMIWFVGFLFANPYLAEWCFHALLYSVFLGGAGVLLFWVFGNRFLGLQNLALLILTLVLLFVPPLTWFLLRTEISWGTVEAPKAMGIAPQATGQVADPVRVPLALTILNVVAWLWLAGGMARLAGLLLTYRRLMAVLENCPRSLHPRVVECARQLGLEGVRIISPAHGATAFVAGLRSPVIALPVPVLERVNDQELFEILRHEKGHLQHRDLPLGVFLNLMLVVQWWNPFAHWISRRLNLVRECLSDAVVVAEGADKTAYANSLLRLSAAGGAFCSPDRETASLSGREGGALAFSASHQDMRFRLLTILDRSQPFRAFALLSSRGMVVLALVGTASASVLGLKVDFGLKREADVNRNSSEGPVSTVVVVTTDWQPEHRTTEATLPDLPVSPTMEPGLGQPGPSFRSSANEGVPESDANGSEAVAPAVLAATSLLSDPQRLPLDAFPRDLPISAENTVPSAEFSASSSTLQENPEPGEEFEPSLVESDRVRLRRNPAPSPADVDASMTVRGDLGETHFPFGERTRSAPVIASSSPVRSPMSSPVVTASMERTPMEATISQPQPPLPSVASRMQHINRRSQISSRPTATAVVALSPVMDRGVNNLPLANPLPIVEIRTGASGIPSGRPAAIPIPRFSPATTSTSVRPVVSNPSPVSPARFPEQNLQRSPEIFPSQGGSPQTGTGSFPGASESGGGPTTGFAPQVPQGPADASGGPAPKPAAAPVLVTTSDPLPSPPEPFLPSNAQVATVGAHGQFTVDTARMTSGAYLGDDGANYYLTDTGDLLEGFSPEGPYAEFAATHPGRIILSHAANPTGHFLVLDGELDDPDWTYLAYLDSDPLVYYPSTLAALFASPLPDDDWNYVAGRFEGPLEGPGDLAMPEVWTTNWEFWSERVDLPAGLTPEDVHRIQPTDGAVIRFEPGIQAFDINPLPEPSAALLASTVLSFVFLRRRRRG